MKQIPVVKLHLLRKGSITQEEAMEKYGVQDLASVVRHLRREGHEIETIPKSEGKPARYRLVSQGTSSLELF